MEDKGEESGVPTEVDTPDWAREVAR